MVVLHVTLLFYIQLKSLTCNDLIHFLSERCFTLMFWRSLWYIPVSKHTHSGNASAKKSIPYSNVRYVTCLGISNQCWFAKKSRYFYSTKIIVKQITPKPLEVQFHLLSKSPIPPTPVIKSTGGEIINMQRLPLQNSAFRPSAFLFVVTHVHANWYFPRYLFWTHWPLADLNALLDQ